MVNCDLYISALEAQFERIRSRHEEHLGLVRAAYGWHNEKLEPLQGEIKGLGVGPVGTTIVLNGAKALCVRVDFRGVPVFVVDLYYMPMSFGDDLGSGAVLPHIVRF